MTTRTKRTNRINLRGQKYQQTEATTWEGDYRRKCRERGGTKERGEENVWTQESGNQADDASGTPVLCLKVSEHRQKISREARAVNGTEAVNGGHAATSRLAQGGQVRRRDAK